MSTKTTSVALAALLSVAFFAACGDDGNTGNGNGGQNNDVLVNNDTNNQDNNDPGNNDPGNNDPNNMPNNDPGNNDPGCEPACVEGEMCVGGVCVPEEPNNDTPICDAGTQRCVDEQNLEVCNDTGQALETQPCPTGSICTEDRCQEVICQAGEVIGCASNTALLTCNDTGTAQEPRECPNPAACVQGTCTVGEGSCTGDDDCINDTYCENTVCLPYPDLPRGEANTSCLQQPYEGEFSPEIQCAWDQGNVIMQPAVVDLDGDETPEIIFTYWGGGGGGNGRVIAIRGDDCSVVGQTPSNFDIEIQASLAVGDINNDGAPEIVTVGGNGEVRAFDNQFNLLWQSPTNVDGNTWGGPAIADLDSDGNPEIVHGLVVLNGEDGTVVFNRPTNEWRYSLGPLSAIADIDNDGDDEIILGNRIYGPDGTDETVPAMAQLQPGHVAIAQFDFETPEPEIAVVSNGQVRVQRIDGTLVFGPIVIPDNGQHGGAPNVGDFDGDGQPEIGVAGSGSYVVFDPECTAQPLPEFCAENGVRWLKPTRDASSGVTGSSLFDFEGDGRADVVYNDECFLRVYDGQTGEVKVAFPNTTNTTYENPVVADVDGDFNSEIVIPANDLARCNPGADTDPDTGTLPQQRRGVVVLRDVTDRWVDSRPVWNQHTYHITNVNNDGSIPAREENNWVRFNNYRQNQQNEGKALYAPDMTADDELLFERTACGALDIRANVFNRGSQPISRGVPVTFFNGDPDQDGQFICTVNTTTRLDPGQGEEVGCNWPTPPNTALDIHVLADTDYDAGLGTLINGNTECFEANNRAVLTLFACE